MESRRIGGSMEQKFETEVLTRLAVIESKLDDYKSIKDKTESAYNLSNNNKKFNYIIYNYKNVL